MLDAVRYYVALLFVALFPGAILYWFSIHPFIRFWRRLGMPRTYWIHGTAIFLLATAIFLSRGRLLRVQFGTNPILIGVAVPLFAASAALRPAISRQLTQRILTGRPEIDPRAYENHLLTEGIYAHIRHPRYAQLLLAAMAFALFTNYLASYGVFLLYLICLVPLVRLEERELLDRFGKPYEDYSARIPRFIPKFRAR